jgi:16S rRNA processing protein RimM
MENLKKIAHIIKTHGLKGEMKIFLLTENINQRFKKGSKVYIDSVEYTVNKISDISSNQAKLSLKEITDINQLEPLVKKDIYAPKLEDELIVYLDEIIGFELIDTSNNVISTVIDYQKIGAMNYFVCNDNKLIPIIEKVFYSLIDVENKKIYLTEQGVDCFYNA